MELARPFVVIKSVASSDVNTVRVFRSYDGRDCRIEGIDDRE